MKFNYDMSICPYIIIWKRGPSRCWQCGGKGRGGEEEVKEDDNKIPKIRLFKEFGFFSWTDRHKDRQTDRQILWLIGKLHFQ